MAAESLYLNTAQLRRLEMVAPATVIGKNTVHAMQSGFVYGYVGLVEAMVQRFKEEMEAPEATVVATGGLAELIAKETVAIQIVNQELTLRGLCLVHALNAVAPTASQAGGRS